MARRIPRAQSGNGASTAYAASTTDRTSPSRERNLRSDGFLFGFPFISPPSSLACPGQGLPNPSGIGVDQWRLCVGAGAPEPEQLVPAPGAAALGGAHEQDAHGSVA